MNNINIDIDIAMQINTAEYRLSIRIEKSHIILANIIKITDTKKLLSKNINLTLTHCLKLIYKFLSCSNSFFTDLICF